MELLAKFITYLEEQKDKPSKSTLVNYRADVGAFIAWFENHFNASFPSQNINQHIFELLKQIIRLKSFKEISIHGI